MAELRALGLSGILLLPANPEPQMALDASVKDGYRLKKGIWLVTDVAQRGPKAFDTRMMTNPSRQ